MTITVEQVQARFEASNNEVVAQALRHWLSIGFVLAGEGDVKHERLVCCRNYTREVMKRFDEMADR